MKQVAIALALVSGSLAGSAQKVTGKLKFEQGQVFEVTMDIKTVIAQQAMGQAIDFNVDAKGVHSFKVTNATEDNTTLHHDVNRISFAFDGMGQKRKFDSNEEKDLNGQFGKPIKDLLSKKYDIIIDPSGQTMMAMPEKVTLAEGDSRLAIVTSMLKDVTDIVQPPKKGKGSFFAVLPAKELSVGDTWTESYTEENGIYDAAYKVSAIGDSTITIDYAGSSVTISKAEMMGNETTTKMNNKSSGKIILGLDNIIIQKNITTESNGSTETSFGNLPVTSKTTIVVNVKKVDSK